MMSFYNYWGRLGVDVGALGTQEAAPLPASQRSGPGVRVVSPELVAAEEAFMAVWPRSAFTPEVVSALRSITRSQMCAREIEIMDRCGSHVIEL